MRLPEAPGPETLPISLSYILDVASALRNVEKAGYAQAANEGRFPLMLCLHLANSRRKRICLATARKIAQVAEQSYRLVVLFWLLGRDQLIDPQPDFRFSFREIFQVVLSGQALATLAPEADICGAQADDQGLGTVCRRICLLPLPCRSTALPLKRFGASTVDQSCDRECMWREI